ncbi:MAG: DDE-type integrase/transposase/recombinase [Firmicutes bacterium]|nr:DDE-type integrase/transposase/recombinase [Bacillota bacterium]
MARIQLKVGQRFKYNQSIYEIKELLLDNKFVAHDLSYGGQKTFDHMEIATLLAQGILAFETFGKNTINSDEKNITTEHKYGDFEFLKEEYKQIAIERYQIIKPLLVNSRTKKDVEERIIEVKGPEESSKLNFYKNKNISVATVYRWIKDYEISDGDIRSLVPDYDECGGQGKSRLSAEVDEIIAEVLSEHYFTSERKTVSFICKEINDRIAHKNIFKNDENKLLEPHKTTILHKVRQLDKRKVTEARYGKREADSKFKDVYTKEHKELTRPLQLVYIDHTPLDLFLVDEDDRLPIGRPTFTYAMDAVSRCPLGFYMGFDEESYRSVAECLYHSIIPKGYVKDLFPDIGEWPVYGLPENLIVDNALEFKSKSMKDACFQLGINLEFARPRVPEDKSIIERFFGTLNTQLLHQTPGTTFSNIFQRKDYDPAKNAVVSVQSLEKLLHSFLIAFINTPRTYLAGKTPLEVWKKGCKEHPPTLPNSGEELHVLLGAVDTRQIRKVGIQFYELYYNSPELARLRLKLSEKEKVKIKYNPNDISHLYVWNRITQKYIKVSCNDQEYTQGLSIFKHKKVVKFVKDKEKKANMENMITFKKIMEQIIDDEWLKTKKSSTKKKLARLKNLEGSIYKLLRDGNYDYFKEREVNNIVDQEEISQNETVVVNINDCVTNDLTSKHILDDNNVKYSLKEKQENSKKQTSNKQTSNKKSNKSDAVDIEDVKPDLTGWA